MVILTSVRGGIQAHGERMIDVPRERKEWE